MSHTSISPAETSDFTGLQLGLSPVPQKLSGELKINYIFNLGSRKKAQAGTVLKSCLLEHTYILS